MDENIILTNHKVILGVDCIGIRSSFCHCDRIVFAISRHFSTIIAGLSNDALSSLRCSAVAIVAGRTFSNICLRSDYLSPCLSLFLSLSLPAGARDIYCQVHRCVP